MDQLILALVVGVFAFAKWLIEHRGNAEEQPGANPAGQGEGRQPAQRRPVPPAGNESEEEQMRRFLEALGLPQGSAPELPKPRPAAEAKPEPQNQFEPIAPKPPRTGPPPAARTPARQWTQRARPIRKQIAPPAESVAPVQPLPKTASTDTVMPAMEVASIPELTFASPESYIHELKPAASQPPVGAPALPETSEYRTGEAQTPGFFHLRLRDPDALRQAIILREILGPPKALQSLQSPSIFSPL
ncbi:MAG: hypothetical protein WCP06_03840 [Verrucomicrobiota bacterium]